MSRRQTGFPLEVRCLIIERAKGYCELCGGIERLQIHHRRARGMGSTRRPETNYASNGLFVCGDDHSRIESRREWALVNGYLVRQNDDPETVPVNLPRGWVLLGADGTVKEAA